MVFHKSMQYLESRTLVQMLIASSWYPSNRIGGMASLTATRIRAKVVNGRVVFCVNIRLSE